jgi:hypothetical protein
VTLVYAVVTSLAGGALLFAGVKVFRFALASAAFIALALITYLFLLNGHVHWDWLTSMVGSNRWYLELFLGGTSVAGGLVGVVMATVMWRVALSVLGALGGITIASMFLLGTSLASLPQLFFPVVPGSKTAYPLWAIFGLLAVSGVSGAVLLRYWERPFIIIATACIGSALLASGMDLFLETGFDPMLLELFLFGIPAGREDSWDKARERAPGMILAWAGASMVGMSVQYAIIGRKVKSHLRK